MPYDISRNTNCSFRFSLVFNRNFFRTRQILKYDGYIPNRLIESRLNRRLHEIDIYIWQVGFQMKYKKCPMKLKVDNGKNNIIFYCDSIFLNGASQAYEWIIEAIIFS